jgi:putative sugar O-methyltransferase
VNKNKIDKELVKIIFEELNQEVNYFKKKKIYKKDINQTKFSSIRYIDKKEVWSKWSKNIIRVISKDLNIITNFRKTNFFITDVPGEMSFIKKLIYNFFLKLPDRLKRYHPKIDLLEEQFNTLTSKGLIKLLRANPSPNTGNPILYKKMNTKFTYRWLRHIWLLNLFNKHLKNRNDIKIVMDIGSNYGSFPYLLKKNNKDLKFILIDFPEALANAKYFIQKEIPNAKIASFKDLKNNKKITKSFIENFDFILVPCFWIEKLEKNLVDLTLNIASLNEMNHFWFKKYTSSDAFRTSKYIFLMNRITRPAVEVNETPIDILDLNLHKFKKIHFDICKLYRWNYTKRKYLFGLPVMGKKSVHPPIYEFIGKKN